MLISFSTESLEDLQSFRYNEPGKPSSLPSVDVFICIPDCHNVSPLVMSNTILSILSVDYPAEKVSCYISDDGASLLTLKTLIEITEFARIWVPFCKKFNIEPRAPESYFSKKVDYARFSIYPTFPKERRLIKVVFLYSRSASLLLHFILYPISFLWIFVKYNVV